MPVKTETNELKLIREFDAPVKTVWDAFTDVNEASKWWGPRGFKITSHSKELKPGGHWEYTMHGPDDVSYVNKTQYFEVEEYKKLVYDHGGNDLQKPLFRVTVLFLENNGKTTMDMTMTFPSAEAAKTTSGFIKKAGGDTTWDRFAEYLEKKLRNKEIFVINRSFDVSVEKMFELWTNPDHLAKWVAPTGFNLEFIKRDIKPGGRTFSCMSNDAGNKMYGSANYLKLEKPNLIIYTQQFSDENDNLARHPMAPNWPATMLTTVKLVEEGPDQTRINLTWECHGETSVEEMKTFIFARSGMSTGWTGSFDKLEEYAKQV